VRTPRKHFNEDIVRAENMVQLAASMEDDCSELRLVQDVRLSAVSLAVGAMDAYFCDAYVDCLTAVLRAYISGNWAGSLPANYSKQQLPAGEVLDYSRESRPLWSLRMATRKIMERDSMLTVSRIDDHFNGILPRSHKLWAGLIDQLINYNSKRLTKVTSSEANKLSGKDKENAKKQAIAKFKSRVSDTVQLRHDWAHNCGRPKSSIRTLTHNQAKARIKELKVFVEAFDDHIEAHRLA
jgi:hypothetical protein